MGSSVRKKKEKKKDFQKPKLKVGKTKAKAANFTDTSFQSRAIVVNQQSLSETAPDLVEQFKHHLSLATSRTPQQRREALSHIASQLTATPPNNPVGTFILLDKLLPLITDTSNGVRSTLLKAFQALPEAEIQPHADKVIKWVRLGMLHLSAEVRDDALKFMDWLLDAAGDQLLEIAGGWTRTLDAFAAMMGWKNEGTAINGAGWSSAPKTTFGAEKGGNSYAHQMTALTKFIELGLQKLPPVKPWTQQQRLDHIYRLPQGPSPFGYLQLFGAPQDGEMCPDLESRQKALWPWKEGMEKKAAQAQMEGGPAGRAARDLANVLKEGFKGYEHDVLEELDW
ncbi:Pre-rRNA-processing protein IPI1 [Cytospora mali]|uniref:Pre-rRNA-processing protein n=1 Tax=Cytospora mali TaxID=578113 RepID=A0A194WDR6_CYTMA|nr:Pre-rRNA-processing protein IPI1 [Valsa mali]